MQYGYNNYGPFGDIGTAVAAWWADYQNVYPGAFPGCSYTQTMTDPYTPDNADGIFGEVVTMPLVGSTCGGWGRVVATSYNTDPARNLGGSDCYCGEGDASADTSSGSENSGNEDTMGAPLAGDPINVATGNKVLQATDFNARDWLTFRRFYNSDAAVVSTSMGTHWRHSFDRSLTVMSGSAGPSAVSISRPDGRSERFTRSGADWNPDVDNPDTLVETDDVNGNPASYTLNVAYLHHIEIYDVSGLLQSVADENGQGIVLTYSTTLTDPNVAPRPSLLLNVTASDGRALNFTYASDGHLHQMTQPDGGTFVYGYDSTGNLTTVQYPDTKVRQYVYNEQNLTGGNNLPSAMTGIIDEAGGRFESTSFDGLGRATFTSLAGGAGQTTISYNASSSGISFALGGGATQTFLIPNGHIRTAAYDAACKPACGTQWQSRTYDANGYPSSYTDFNGNLTQVTYSASGLLTGLVEASGSAVQRTTDTTWDTTLRRPTLRTLKDAAGTLVTKDAWVYNTRGQPLATCSIDPVKAGSYVCAATGTPPDGVRRTTYTYCDAISPTCPLIGLTLTIDGPRTDVNDVTTFSYYTSSSATSCGTPGAACHQAGDLYQVNNALGQTTTYSSYDANGRVTRITDPNGTNTDFTYTPRGWPLTRTYGGATTTYGHDAMGNINQITDADNVITTFTYDGAHRLTDVTDGAGNHIHYTLDAAGNRTSEQVFEAGSTLKRSLSRTYNSNGQLTAVIDGLGHTVFSASDTDSYDANGNLVHSRDAMGFDTRQTFDGLNRLADMTRNAGGVDPATQNTSTGYTYDPLDAPATVTDPGGLTTTFVRDGLSNTASVTSPDTGGAVSSYDAVGNLVSTTDAKGVTVTRTFDALNRAVSLTYPDSTLNVALHYDEANAVTGCASSKPLGRLTRVVESQVTTSYCYDARGNLIAKLQTLGTTTDTTGFTYTSSDRLKTLTYPSGSVLTYTRDVVGRVTSATLTPPGGTAATVVSNIAYLPFGPVTSYQLGNTQTVSRTYDANYAFTDVTSPALAIHVARDNAGDIIALGAAHGASPATETYAYDPLYRLTGVIAGSTTEQTFAYNPSGDRVSKSGSGLSTGTYAYFPGTHRLSSVGNAARTADANGNVTASASGGQTWGFGYNARNRLTVAQENQQTVASYTYNMFGERVSKSATSPSAVNERFSYDQSQRTIAEYGTSSRDYIWVDNLPVAVLDIVGASTTLSFIHADGLNTPRAVTSSAGATLWQWPFSANPFGEQPPTGSFTLNLRFAGQYSDSETGLSYNVHRTYEPGTGRYLESDPIGLNGGVNTYSYVTANPLSFLDFYGLCKCEGMGSAPDPRDYERRGQNVNPDNVSPMTPYGIGPGVAGLNNLGQLSDFRRGGPLDAQVRYGGSTAYANYVFGVYLSAAGWTLPQTLDAANDYARARSQYPQGTPMAGPDYPYTPAANVANITRGFNDQRKGTLCTK